MSQFAFKPPAAAQRMASKKPPAASRSVPGGSNQAAMRQPLTIGPANDAFERQADEVADKVVGMSATDPPVAGPPIGAPPAVQAKSDGTGPAAAPPIVHAVLGSPGRPLDGAMRAYFEPRFGRDFGNVRVHADSKAAQSAAAIGAAAYTVGNDVVFGAGQASGAASRRLMAHELAHVRQQASGSARGAGAKVVQRSRLPTHFGEFEDFKYGDLTNGTGASIGVEMYMKFHPNSEVRADLIAMTQSAHGQVNGTPANQGLYGQHSASHGAGTGSFIDVLEGYASPLYATTQTVAPGGSAANMADYQTAGISALTTAQQTARTAATGVSGVGFSGFGQHGFRKVVAGAFVTQPAEMYDSPQLGAAGANSEQIFETTALAIAGPQNGTYYGSVEWGWRKDAHGTFSRLPFRVVSQGVPSATFLTAANIWNPSKASFGYIATVATNLLDAALQTVAAVPIDSELVPTGRQASGGGHTYFEVTYGGHTGFVINTAVRAAAIGAETVDLPVPLIHQVSNPAGTTMIRSGLSLGSSSAPTLAPATLALPAGTRVRTTRCMAPTAILPNHYEGDVVDGPQTGVHGFFFVPDLTAEALGTH